MKILQGILSLDPISKCPANRVVCFFAVLCIKLATLRASGKLNENPSTSLRILVKTCSPAIC